MHPVRQGVLLCPSCQSPDLFAPGARLSGITAPLRCSVWLWLLPALPLVLAMCRSLWQRAHPHGLLSLSVHAHSPGPWAACTASRSGTGTPTPCRPVPCSYPWPCASPSQRPTRRCCCFDGVRLGGVHTALLQATWEVVQPGYTLNALAPDTCSSCGPTTNKPERDAHIGRPPGPPGT